MSQITISHAGVSNKEGEFFTVDSVNSTYFSEPPVSLIRVGTQVLSYSGPTYNIHQAWFRFRLPLNGNVTITRAVLRFTTPDGWPENPHGGGGTTETELTIKGHKSTNSAGPTNQSEALNQSGPSSTIGVLWTSDLKAQGATFYSPNIAVIIQEIIDQVGWAADNYITIYIKSNYQPYYRKCTITSESFQASAPSWVDPWILEPDALAHLVIDYESNPLDGLLVEHELEIIQLIDVFSGKEEVNHTLQIEQEIVGIVDRIRHVVDDLEIFQDFKVVVPYEISVSDFVFIAQDIDVNVVQTYSIEHTVDISQDIIGQTKFDKTVVHTLEIENDDITSERDYNRTVESAVELEQDIDTNLKTRSVVHGLLVNQTVSTDGSLITTQEVISTLEIEQEIDFNRVSTRGTEHEIDIESYVVGYFEERDGCDRLDITYSPFADSSVDFPEAPTLTQASDITLAYPPSSPTETITLPVPLMADREELLITRIQRQTRGGTLKTFSSDVWPKVRTFRYKFDNLSTDKIEEMFAFLGLTLGLKMRLTDHEGRLWDGYIVNPQGEAGQFMRFCGGTTEFDFEGVEV